MSSSLKYNGLSFLRSTQFIINFKFTTTTCCNTTLPLQITNTLTRNYHYQLCSSIDLNYNNKIYNNNNKTNNNWRLISPPNQQQQYHSTQTAVGINSSIISSSSTSLLNLIKTKDKTRLLSSFHKYKNIMDSPPGIFKGSLDRFNGITIDSSLEFNKEDNFPEKLQKSLSYWLEQKRRAIWFHVKTEHSEWVPHLTKQNFEFHHAKDGMVVLYRWLPEDEYPNLPVYSHTMLGVGGLVVNDKDEVLVVSERFALIPNSWKLPGGYAEPNENIVDAAIREVREETGIESVFNTVICLRHAHGGPFGCSDIYCVVALTPTTSQLQRCEREIAKVQWMPCNEYLTHPNVHETNRHFLRCYLDYKKRGIRFTCELAQHQILKKDYCLYYMKAIEESENGDGQELGKL